MLNKLFLRAAATAVTMTFAAGPASADNFQILMMDYAFFPEISYVKPGDTVTFVNMSGITRVISDRSGSWATPELADGQEATITIEQGMKNEFLTKVDGVGGNGVTTNGGGGTDPNTDLTDGTSTAGQDDEEGTIIGKLNFSDAPALVTE